MLIKNIVSLVKENPPVLQRRKVLVARNQFIHGRNLSAFVY
jgi:hypothetical protein